MKTTLMILLYIKFTYAVNDVEEIRCLDSTDILGCCAQHDVWCIRNQTEESNSYGSDSIKISWDYGDKRKGEVHLSIVGRICLYTYCTLELHRYDDSNVGNYSDTNKQVTFNSVDKNVTYKSHSQRSIKEEDWNSNKTYLPSCDQVKNVTFTFMYTGCYLVIIKNAFPAMYSDPICVTTDFKQEFVYNQTITVLSQYLEDLTQLKHVVSDFSKLQVKRMELQVWTWDDEITHCDKAEELISSQIIVLKSSQTVCIDKYAAIPCHLDRKKDEIVCFTNNVTVGYYCFLVKLNNDPCNNLSGNTVWNGKEIYCSFSGEIEKVTMPKNETVRQPAESRDTRYIILICTVFLCAVVIVCLIFYRKWNHQKVITGECREVRSSNLDQRVGKSSSVPPDIYLMYSRDCQAFMEVMKIFRFILKEILKCEVYDCFDPAYYEDMARIGMNWPGKIISNDNVKIILVETKCAKLHLQGHTEDFKVVYQEPTAWDDYFLCSLKTVIHNPKYNSYHKLYITRIEGFTSEQDKLMEVTPYTRYDIPGCLYHLLASILQEYDLTVPDDWNHNIQKLQEVIKNLENYQKDCKNYLDKLLIRREAYGFRKLISKFKH